MQMMFSHLSDSLRGKTMQLDAGELSATILLCSLLLTVEYA